MWGRNNKKWQSKQSQEFWELGNTATPKNCQFIRRGVPVAPGHITINSVSNCSPLSVAHNQWCWCLSIECQLFSTPHFCSLYINFDFPLQPPVCRLPSRKSNMAQENHKFIDDVLMKMPFRVDCHLSCLITKG